MLVLARRLVWSVIALVTLFAAATLITARWGNPALYPPAPDAPAMAFYVVSHGYHAGIAVSRADLAAAAQEHQLAALTALTSRFSQFSFLEIGWGEEEFYRHVPTAASLTFDLAVRALLLPGNPSVLHVVGLTHSPRESFPMDDIVALRLSEEGFLRAAVKLDASFAPTGVAALQELGPGLYGPSLFFRANGHFNMFNVCNHWVASVLDAAGVPVAPMLATLPSGLLLDLRLRSHVAPLPTLR